MLKRIAGIVLAALFVAMLLSTAGHALGHHEHQSAAHDCPVCAVLCAWKDVIERLLMAAFTLFGMAALRALPHGGAAWFAAGMPRRWTPVGLKVKLTS